MAAAKSLPFLLLILFLVVVLVNGASLPSSAGGGILRPAAMVAAGGMKSVLIEEAGRHRRLSSFQICALCTCCGGPRGLCLPSPCCYSINCNIPNRPFGFCAFTPKTCNCFGCHL